MRYLNFFLFFLCAGLLHAQEEYKKKFPNAEAVYTNLSCEVNIKISDEGKIIATSDYSEDIMYLTDNAVKMMSRGLIYHSDFRELKKWDAYTQLSEKKRLKITNSNTASSHEDYIFYDDVKATSFDYTGGLVGATRHLDYELLHNDAHLLSPHYFERYLPVINGELRITFPEDIKLKYILKGLKADKIHFSESRKKDKITYSFRVSDLDGVKSYDDAPDNAYYATHLIFYVEQIKENGEWKNFLSNVDDLYKYSFNYIKKINQSLSEELRNLTDSLVKNIITPVDKTKKIYSWVQSHIKYVAFEEGLEGFIPREASLVCSRRFGDCKDMASILTSMLNYAGVPAYFTWIGTRDIPYDYTEIPLPIVDNHMICTVRSGDDYIFLDATDDGCIFGMPSSHIQGKQALISIDEKEYRIVRVPEVNKEKNILTDSTYIELTNNGIAGKIKVRMTGYYSSRMESILNLKNLKEREDYFKSRFNRGSNKINFTNWKVEQKPDHSECLITADFTLPEYAKKLGDEWFINMNLFKWYEHAEIDFPKRKMPIEFSFLRHSSYVTDIKIPAGFRISFMPQSETFKNDVWGFVMKYDTSNGHISLSQEFDDNQMMLYENQFESWNKVLEHLFPHYKQTVVFSKN